MGISSNSWQQFWTVSKDIKRLVIRDDIVVHHPFAMGFVLHCGKGIENALGLGGRNEQGSFCIAKIFQATRNANVTFLFFLHSHCWSWGHFRGIHPQFFLGHLYALKSGSLILRCMMAMYCARQKETSSLNMPCWKAVFCFTLSHLSKGIIVHSQKYIVPHCDYASFLYYLLLPTCFTSELISSFLGPKNQIEWTLGMPNTVPRIDDSWHNIYCSGPKE